MPFFRFLAITFLVTLLMREGLHAVENGDTTISLEVPASGALHADK